MIVRKLITLWRVGHEGRLVVAEAVLELARARLSLAVFSFERVAGRVGRLMSPDDARARGVGTEVDEGTMAVARKVGWAVCTVAPSMPFKALCLQQALAAHAMLRRRGIEVPIHFGVGRNESSQFEAHAWLEVAGVEVTGYPVAASLREIGCFVSERD